MRYLFLIATLALMGCANTEKAEKASFEYIAINYPGEKVAAVTCERSDSDGDGRVRCNISMKREGGNEVVSVECPASWVWQPLTTSCVGIKGRGLFGR